MANIKAHFFGSSAEEVIPNTFIGGVGASYITSALDFVSKTWQESSNTPISVSNIKGFTIDSDNVSFFIDVNYKIVNWNTSENTYYIDLDGYVTSDSGIVNGFGSATVNLTHLYLNSLVRTSAGRDLILSGLKHVNLESLETLRAREGFRLFDVKKLYLPSFISYNETILGRSGGFTDMTSLKRLYLPNFNTLSTDMTNGCIIRENFNNIGFGCKVYYNSAFGVTDRNSFNYIEFVDTCSVGDTFTINGLIYTAVTTVLADGDFVSGGNTANQSNNLFQSIEADTRTGKDYTAIRFNEKMLVLSDGVGVANQFTTTSGVGNVCISTWDWSLTSMVGGNDVHPFLMNLRDNYSAVLIENPNIITVNAPSSLSASNQTATTVNLNFTAPTANANGTDGYEVWVDDGTVYRYLFEFDEITSSGDTLDLTEAGNLTGVKIKIRTIDGNYNFSAFSNEITL